MISCINYQLIDFTLMYDKPLMRRGRGASSNRSGRFERLQRVNFDDGWAPVHLETAVGHSDDTIDYDESSDVLRTAWREDTARSVITKNDSPDLHFDQSINPYRGCEHGCSYCFARPSHTYLGHSAGLDFERLLYAKLEAPTLLRKELANPRYRCQPIAVGVNTDAYQPLEKKLQITRRVLEVLLETKHPAYLITKSSLIERDLDLLIPMAEANLVTVSISVTSLDKGLSQRLEPRASAPHRRLRTIQTLSQAGIPVRASISPIIPALNEHELERIVEECAKAGVIGANAMLLRLPHELSSLFAEWLELHYPMRKERVLKAIRSMRQGKLNRSEFGTRFVGEGPRAEIIQQRFKRACKQFGIDCGREKLTLNTELFHAHGSDGKENCAEDEGIQMSLFS